MLTNIKKLLSPPIHEDEEINRRTRLLNMIVWQFVIAISFFLFAGLLLNIAGRNTLLIFGMDVLFVIGVLYLIRRGKVNTATTIFVTFYWLMITFTMFFYGGMKTQVFIAYTVVVLITAFLLSERAAIMITIISILAGALVLYLESVALLPTPLEPYTPIRGLLIAGASALYLTMLLIVFTRSIQRTLRYAQNEIAERKRVEAALREGEERYRNLFSRIPVGLYRSTPQGEILNANPAIVEMFGYNSHKQFMAANVSEFYVDINDRKKMNQQLEKPNDVYHMEARFKRTDGEIIWGEDISRAVCDEDGNIIYYEGSLTDITDRKQTEQALLESEERYRILAENAIDMISKHDLEGRFLYVSPACVQLLGYSADEIIGKSSYEFIHPEDIPKIKNEHKIIVEQSITNMVSYRLRQKDGEYRYVETTSKSITDPETGEITEILAITRDISERIKAENSLRESEQHLRILMDQAPVAILTTDMQGNITDVNPYTLELLGSPSREKTLSLNLLELPNIKDAGLDQVYRKVIKHGGFQDVETTYTSIWGKSSHVRVRMAPLHNALGDQIGVIQIAEDISERTQIEAALLTSEEKYRMLFNTMLNGFALHEIVTDENGKPIDYVFLEVNSAYEEITGLKSENIIGKSVLEILPNIEPVWIKRFGAVAISGNPDRFLDYAAELGKYYEVVAFSPQPNQFAAVVTDVTERIAASEALRESQQMLRLILDHIPEAVFWKDENSIYMGCNRAFAQDVGYDAPQDVIGKTDHEFVWNEEADKYRDTDCQVIENGVAKLNVERKMTISSGEEVWVRTSKVPLRDAENNVVGVLGVSQHITEQKRAADAIKHERDVANALMQASWAVNSSLDFNRVLEHILQQINQVIPSEAATIMLVDGEYAHVHSWRGYDQYGSDHAVKGLTFHIPTTSNLTQMAETKQPMLIKDTHNYPGWKVVDDLNWVVSVMSTPLLAKDQVVGYLHLDGTTTDTFTEDQIEVFTAFAGHVALAIENAQLYSELSDYTEQLETRVNERTNELQEANHELEAFTYTVSHDLRSPLRAINGFSRIILDDHKTQLDPEVIRYLDLVRSNAKQMGELIDDLLNFSRLARQTLSRRKVELEPLVTEVFEEMVFEFNDRDVEVITGELPDCYADSVLLKLVFQNLINNALKFTRQREKAVIEINCKVIEGENVYFIRDNGVGFDLKYANKLFGVFQRLHSSSEYEGTGVGLAIVHRIIKRHNGEIWVEAKEGEGATFFFTLGGGTLSNDD
ncbi:MAG: PAS domain S-box protein [Anaerolineales bacterium]|nr:PAS domain S-box protein [Anaerolineales bacterium]